jgi:hypothetical protein
MMKKLLFIVIVLIAISSLNFDTKKTKAAPGDVEISDGSVTALYHFNDQSLTDNSGNGKDGTNGASPVSFTSSAKLGAYAANTGGSGYFTSVSSTMRIQGDFTIGFWVKPITTSWSDAGTRQRNEIAGQNIDLAQGSLVQPGSTWTQPSCVGKKVAALCALYPDHHSS